MIHLHCSWRQRESCTLSDAASTIEISLSKSSYDGVTSALVNLYTECGVSRDVNNDVKEMCQLISIYKKGVTRDGARQRQALGLRTTEGKDSLPFAAYTYLCELLHKSSNPEHIAAYLFLVLNWNMISHTNCVITSNI